MDSTENARLDRIEEKIDRLSDAIITLARVEEKISDLELRRAESHERVNRISKSIDDISIQTSVIGQKVAILEKTTWCIVSAIVTGAVGMLYYIQ